MTLAENRIAFSPASSLSDAAIYNTRDLAHTYATFQRTKGCSCDFLLQW